jgi:DNA invertase Pin-like site-specific DNA recombinase
MMSKEKIQPEHLDRPAFVYVRQSNPGQVRHHHESRRLQYGLAEHARALGWRDVIVIDDDQGKSATSTAGRVGFQRLVATVGLGQAGAIFGIDVARLARNNRDWYQVLDLCGLLNTLIVDTEAIYDPRLLNDRLLLGLKGTISEAEIGWLRQRAHEALLAKARRGELVIGLPVGYVRTPDGHVEKDPDQRIQQALSLVFERFGALGSARQVLLWCRQEGIALPVVNPDGQGSSHVGWHLPVYGTILRVLQNPIYAGAYAFGRTGTRTHIEAGVARKSRGHRRRRPEEWIVLLRDHHEAYIAWDSYERHQRMLADNANMRGAMAKGAVRRGQGLLAGLLRCGQCGRRLHVMSPGRRGAFSRYQCVGAKLNHGALRGCLGIGGLRVDAAVESEVLRVVAPGAIEAALDTADRVADQTDATRRALELEVRHARYDAARAQRQYDAAEPEHRLVVETLERRWNAALERVTEVEQRLAAMAAEGPPRTAVDRAQLLTLAHDFPAVWRHPSNDVQLKKRLVRVLIEEIVVTMTAEPPQMTLIVHWKGGTHTQLVVRKNRAGGHRYCTDREIIDVVRELARSLADGAIARILNRLGYRTGHDNSWTAPRVASLRNGHQIPVFDRVASAGVLTMENAATGLGVSPMTIRRLITLKVLPATQPVPYAPWAIRQEDLALERVQRAAAAVKNGRALPQPGAEMQLTLANSQT